MLDEENSPASNIPQAWGTQAHCPAQKGALFCLRSWKSKAGGMGEGAEACRHKVTSSRSHSSFSISNGLASWCVRLEAEAGLNQNSGNLRGKLKGTSMPQTI